MLSTRTLCVSLVISFVIRNVCCEETASVFRIIPRTAEHLKILYSLDNNVNGISFWKDLTGINKTVDVMVPSDQLKIFKVFMKNHELVYDVQIPDVQRLLNNATKRGKRTKTATRAGESFFGWSRFHTLDEIYNWLDFLSLAYPDNVKTIEGGRTYEGRPIKGVHLTFAPYKSAVFIEGGIHAREWLSHSTTTYLINELLTSNDPEIRELAQSFDWYIFPVFNPDGYVFTHINPQDADYRLWRKTRSSTIVKRCWSKELCHQRTCYGADLNRNWGFSWGGAGSSRTDGCSDTFAGTDAFSEMESRTMSQYISSIADNLFAYISFHTYIEKLMFPYGHTSERLDNYNEQLLVGIEAVNGLSKKYGSRFPVGNVAEILGGAASGGSIDWVKANFKVPFVYCYELRGQTKSGQRYGFIAPSSEIIPSGQEVVDSFVAMFKAAAQYYPLLKRNQ